MGAGITACGEHEKRQFGVYMANTSEKCRIDSRYPLVLRKEAGLLRGRAPSPVRVDVAAKPSYLCIGCSDRLESEYSDHRCLAIAVQRREGDRPLRRAETISESLL